jgi:very-short-patch-repair endonuclease
VAASHRAAAGLHGLPGVLPGAGEVTAYGGTKVALDGITVHQAQLLIVDDLTEASGVPVTTPSRTLVDMAPAVDSRLLAKMVDHAVRRELCCEDDLLACLDRLGADRRHGSARIRRLVTGDGRTGSALEALWLRRLRRAGLEPPARQHQLVVDGRVIVLDFAWPAQRVGLECDGFAYHSSRSGFDRDRLRDLLTARLGWTVIRVTSTTPVHEVVATVSELCFSR